MKENVNLNDERKTDGLSSFAAIALPMLKKALGKKGMVGADILSMWEHIVGEDTASYTFPEKIEFKRGQRCGGTLKLKVPAGGFALEVQHREKIIVEKINLYFGYNAVSCLKIIQDGSLTPKMLKKSNQPTKQKSLVSNEEQNYINELTNDVVSENLKKSLQRLGQSVFSKEHKKV
ncbi:MAG: DUF721 domain-containing protein [Alphaproteobacteria bacterium]|nr:DUF721 domain-containing protein [Alphaproteobacteria bacterium]